MFQVYPHKPHWNKLCLEKIEVVKNLSDVEYNQLLSRLSKLEKIVDKNPEDWGSSSQQPSLHHNKLTPAELERLAYLAEECGEVIQAVNKIIRHGYDSRDPTNPSHKGNRFDLTREIVDVGHTISLIIKNDTMNTDLLKCEKDILSKKMYFHHQD